MRWLLVAMGAALVGPILMAAPLIGMMASPWGPFWFGERAATTIDVGGQTAAPVDVPQIAHGFVSDAERYLLARAAGWTFQEAITAVAVSIAEDGSGDPAALSPANTNGTRDLGLWQVNSAWWPQFGGSAALVDPFTNARAAFVIFGRQGWCAWSTFERGCGPGHTGAYVAFLGRARAAAEQG
jgi:hypothetical protein